jgi:hypothetical protein
VIPGIRVLLTVLVALLSVPVSAQTTGGISGCLRDAIVKEPLPRATVTATSAGTKLVIVADAGGCFEFTELPPNVYRVTARLLGLITQLATKSASKRGRRSKSIWSHNRAPYVSASHAQRHFENCLSKLTQ